MDRLWKQLMHLDARGLFFGAVALFAAVVAIVAWLYFHRAAATVQTQPAAGAATATACREIGVLGLVSNQMAADALVVPVNPFRPGIEHMLLRTNPAVITGATNGTTRIRWSSKTNLFAGLRPDTNSSGPVTPTLTFRGYFQRPDGTPAALFHDSTDNSSRFFTAGSKIRDATLVATSIRSAQVQKPDGQTVDLAIGDSFTLPAGKP